MASIVNLESAKFLRASSWESSKFTAESRTFCMENSDSRNFKLEQACCIILKFISGSNCRVTTLKHPRMSLKGTDKRRTVFKPLLDNPFPSSQFPLVPYDLQQQIMEFLLLQLKDIASWNTIKGTKPVKPEILNYLTMGFNSTVKFLESQAKEQQNSPMKYVFVCKTEISPQLLIQQFPILCYSASNDVKVKLIQLPRGAMSQLQENLGTKCTILGMLDNDVISPSFKELLESVPDVEVPWLNTANFHELKVRMLETTAPIIKKQKK